MAISRGVVRATGATGAVLAGDGQMAVNRTGAGVYEITFGADVRIGNDDTFDLSLENAGARTGGVERVSAILLRVNTFSAAAAPADSDFNLEWQQIEPLS